MGPSSSSITETCMRCGKFNGTRNGVAYGCSCYIIENARKKIGSNVSRKKRKARGGK